MLRHTLHGAGSEEDLAQLFAWTVRSGSTPRAAGSPTVPSGCTDSLATNYEARALAESGTCEYDCARLTAHYFTRPGRGQNRTARCFVYNALTRAWSGLRALRASVSPPLAAAAAAAAARRSDRETVLPCCDGHGIAGRQRCSRASTRT